MRSSLVVLTLAAVAGAHTSGCRQESCLSDAKGCVVASPCGDLGYTCDSGGVAAEVKILTAKDAPPKAANALAAVGDIQLSNDKVVAVIDALDSRHYIATSGGSLLDLSVRGKDDDGINLVLQATGILPADQMEYE